MASKTKVPGLTLRDPATKKTAALNDEQAVRALLAAIIERIGAEDVWRTRLPKDSTERVAAQILRKGDGVGQALAIVREAETLHAMLEGTDLEPDVAGKRPPKASEKLRGVTGDDALDKLINDVASAVSALWPTYEQSLIDSEGEEKKKMTVSAEFVPESDDADSYIRVVAETKVSTTEITRTSKVRKLSGGRRQLELF